MNEGRLVLCVFGVAALLMIGLPVGMILTADGSVPRDVALKGEVSAFFLASQPGGKPLEPRQTLPGITRVLPAGMPDKIVFKTLAASGFTCVPDSYSASCFRTYAPSSGCDSDWRVSVTFDQAGLLRLSEADRRTTCL